MSANAPNNILKFLFNTLFYFHKLGDTVNTASRMETHGMIVLDLLTV